jgi:putative NIF3 family GTP cyclohydrolase 1 type 2
MGSSYCAISDRSFSAPSDLSSLFLSFLVRAAIHPSHSNNERLISTVGVWAGSGTEMMNYKADLYLTGELGHHDVLEALEQQSTVVLCEHSNTERGYLKDVLKPKLEELLSQDGGEAVEIIVSTTDKDPLAVV